MIFVHAIDLHRMRKLSYIIVQVHNVCWEKTGFINTGFINGILWNVQLLIIYSIVINYYSVNAILVLLYLLCFL